MRRNIYKRNLIVPSLKILIDAVALVLSIVFSYRLRFDSFLTGLFPVTKGVPDFSGYLYFSLFLLGTYVFLFAVFQSYRTRTFSTLSNDIVDVFKVCLLGIFIAMSGAFLYRDFSYSRLVFILIYINSNLFILLGRIFFHMIKGRLIARDYGIIRVYVVGSRDQIGKVIDHLVRDRKHNFRPVGFLCDEIMPEYSGIPYLGRVSDLPGQMEDGSPDGLIIAFDQQESQRLLDIMHGVEGKNVELLYIPDLRDIVTANYGQLDIGGMLLLQLKTSRLSGWQGVIKFVFDWMISLMVMILFSPVMLLIAVLIKTTSRGPVIYQQERIGLDGRIFRIYKFRSMVADAEVQSGPVWAKPRDPRVTFIGSILRRYSLDELPQLFNVLKGDMSLVGPRPERPHFVEQFRGHIPKYPERHRVRSGITGWAQVNGLRGQSPIEDRTTYDVYYIENWSLWFDLKILILTVIAIIRGENAY